MNEELFDSFDSRMEEIPNETDVRVQLTPQIRLNMVIVTKEAPNYQLSHARIT